MFKRSQQRYGRTPEPDTPYARAGQVWDERIGSARAQARNWRLMAFGLLGFSASLSAALAWQSAQSRVQPYVVEIDRLGEARAAAPADGDYRPTDPQIAWHLSKFIAKVRTRSLDPVLMRQDWLEAYDVAGREASAFLGDYARADDPFVSVGERTVSVQVTSVVRASDRSFQVKWTEQAFERGHLAGRSRWTAILTVSVKPPTTAEGLRKNPLGLIVEAIDWSQEVEPMPGQGGSRIDLPTAMQPPVVSPQASTPSASIPAGSPLDPVPAQSQSSRIHP